jgi:peptidoglycan/xylan/chitin deacetylase (PgdA/CDA1 family)
MFTIVEPRSESECHLSLAKRAPKKSEADPKVIPVSLNFAGAFANVFGAVVLSASKSIAITFDDGPTGESAKLLDILANNSVKATFFQVDMNMQKYPKSSELIFSKGHELGNHDDNYDMLGSRASASIQASLATLNGQIKQVTGSNPLYFRAPGLDYGAGSLAAVCKTLGFSLIGTDVIRQDWGVDDRGQRHEVRTRRRNHPAPRELRRSKQIRAVTIIIAQLKGQGYDVVDVGDLFKAKNKTPVPGQRYNSIQSRDRPRVCQNQL